MKKVSIARIAVALGIIFGVSGLLSVGLLVWGSWITPFEKRDINAALGEIQAVRQFQGQDSDAYRKQVTVAEQAVSNCRKQAITGYDSRLTMLVEMQFETAVKEQKAWKMPDSDPMKNRMLVMFANSDRKMDDMLREHVQ